MNRLTTFGILLLLGLANAQEITTVVPGLAEEVAEPDEPNSIENTLQSESSSDLIELIEGISLHVS